MEILSFHLTSNKCLLIIGMCWCCCCRSVCTSVSIITFHWASKRADFFLSVCFYRIFFFFFFFIINFFQLLFINIHRTKQMRKKKFFFYWTAFFPLSFQIELKKNTQLLLWWQRIYHFSESWICEMKVRCVVWTVLDTKNRTEKREEKKKAGYDVPTYHVPFES